MPEALDRRMMKHKNSHLLVGYWSRLRKGKQLPHQTDFDPRAIKRMLADFFILDASDLARPCYRLAGTGLCERFGFELKGTSFFAHWEAQSGAVLATLMKQSLKLRLPLCLSSIGATADNGMVELETVLAPVSWGKAEPSRFIGMVQLLSDASPLAGRTIVFERLVGSQIVREDEPFPSFDRQIPPSLPASGTTVRSHPRAPHLRLVVDRDRLAPVLFESEILLERMANALGVEVESDSKRVS
jgi:hypothetical protein